MTKKLDKDHVESIQTLQDQFSQNARYLGSIIIEIELLQQQIDQLTETKTNLIKEFTSLRELETNLIADLKARYGDGEINIETGTFTPAG
jgi:TolA-binding protein